MPSFRDLIKTFLEEEGDPQYESAFDLAGIACDHADLIEGSKPAPRSAREIMDECTELARAFAEQDQYVLAEDFDFRTAVDPRSQAWWHRASLAMEILQATSVQDALTELEDAGNKLYLIVKSKIDPAAAWHSCTIAATSVEAALKWCELGEHDVDHVTMIGTAEPGLETGIVLSQKD